ncbi:MAG: hypothetical protein QM765_23140 [Myxococcales bacterium]
MKDYAAGRAPRSARPSSNGNARTGWILKPRSKTPAATVLYLHGSYGNVSLMLFSVEPLVAAGFQIVTVDYQGYFGRVLSLQRRRLVVLLFWGRLERAHWKLLAVAAWRP